MQRGVILQNIGRPNVLVCKILVGGSYKGRKEAKKWGWL